MSYKFTEKDRKKARESRLKNLKEEFLENDFGYMSNHAVKNRLELLGIPYKCNICQIKEWQGKPISLEVDHMDGDSYNNKIENLQLVCPNCHSQTKNFRGRNINSGRKKVTDEQLIAALEKHKGNVRQALIEVKLAPKGGNYVRAQKLMNNAGMVK